jgi:hypothetical protein
MLLKKYGVWGIVAKAPCVSFCETKSHFRGAASDGVQNGMGGREKFAGLNFKAKLTFDASFLKIRVITADIAVICQSY